MRLFYGLQRQYIVVQHKRNYKKKNWWKWKVVPEFHYKIWRRKFKEICHTCLERFFFDLNKSSCCKKVGYQVKMLITNEFYSSKSIWREKKEEKKER